MKKYFRIVSAAVAVFLFSMVLLAGGCSGGKNAAGDGQNGSTDGPSPFIGLCDKLKENEALAGTKDEKALEEIRIECIQMHKNYSGKSAQAYVDFITNSCDGKEGAEWVSCYGKSLAGAGVEAQKASQ